MLSVNWLGVAPAAAPLHLADARIDGASGADIQTANGVRSELAHRTRLVRPGLWFIMSLSAGCRFGLPRSTVFCISHKLRLEELSYVGLKVRRIHPLIVCKRYAILVVRVAWDGQYYPPRRLTPRKKRIGRYTRYGW